jgi:LysM repeat protein
MRKLALMLLLIAAGTGIANGSAHAADSNTDKQIKHKVASGESLSIIATDNKLETWRPIWNANAELTNPDVISVDQELVIPKADDKLADRPLPAGYGEPTAAPAPVASSNRSTGNVSRSRSSAAPTGDIFARIRARESGGNYATNTGNGYYGAYQFSLGTWQGVGGSGLPSNASPAEQDMRAQLLYQQRGCGPWAATCY